MKSLLITLTIIFSIHARSADDAVEVALVIQDGKFIPTEIKVPAGKPIELVIENKGPGPEEFESIELKREKIIPAGRTVKIKLGILKKKTYSFFGDFHPDTAQGRIVVE